MWQAKNIVQAEIDAACELIDFLRFNVMFAQVSGFVIIDLCVIFVFVVFVCILSYQLITLKTVFARLY